MPRFTHHELLDLQEHIRSEAATAETCRQYARMTTDPDLRTFCENEARQADQTARRLMSMLQGGTH